MKMLAAWKSFPYILFLRFIQFVFYGSLPAALPTQRIQKDRVIPGLLSSASGGRTHTMSPSTDFKSVASADSAIAPRMINFNPTGEKVKPFAPEHYRAR